MVFAIAMGFAPAAALQILRRPQPIPSPLLQVKDLQERPHGGDPEPSNGRV